MKMKTSLCWMWLTLLSCCSFSDVAPSHSTCPCNASTDVIEVPCPNVTADEMTFDLLRDRDAVANVKCVREKKNAMLKCDPFPPRGGVALREDGHRDSASFLVAASRRGLYRCEGTVIFPPPMIKVPGALRIQVLEGLPCTCGKDGGNRGDSDDPGRRFVWIWIAVVVFLTIYSVTVTTVAVVNWVKLRNVDSHSDYINTKPRATRERRKKRGVQKPIPRHF